jgi:hypothetical protein
MHRTKAWPGRSVREGRRARLPSASAHQSSEEIYVSEHTGVEAMTDEELAAEGGEELPDREAMSLINANVAAPINAAVALNALSDNSVAYANAEQTATITQGN